MGNLKEKLYAKLIESNPEVEIPYRQYVDSNLDFHVNNRLKSWRYLLKLILKSKMHLKINIKSPAPVIAIEKKENLYIDGCESKYKKRLAPRYFAKRLMGFDVVSFDIFDTLLLRKFDKPDSLFMLVGEKLGILNFFSIRKEAEKKAREYKALINGNREITIYDIYEIIEEETGIKKDVGVQVEFELEKDILFANPYMLRVFKILKSQGVKVIATSDMYLPKKLISELMEIKGYGELDEIYVSCEYNCSKRDGGLYNFVKNIYKGQKIAHIGDNHYSDYKKAGELGLYSHFYQNVNIRGNKFRSNKDMCKLVGSAYNGIVNAKMHNGLGDYSPYYEYGYIYGGLYVLGFCVWIHKYCKENNIDKVLFLSRDGAIYKKVFNHLFSDIENEYFLWSRIANVKYCINFSKYDFLTRVVDHKAVSVIPVTISSVLKSMSLEWLEPMLPKYKLQPKQNLDKSSKKIFKKLIMDNFEDIKNCYNNEALKLKNITEHAIFGCKKIAIVDVGWTGTCPLGLKSLIEKEWKFDCEVACLMAGGKSSCEASNLTYYQTNKLNTYMFNPIKNKNLYNYHSKHNKGLNSIFFEMFSQDVTPSFSGFKNHEFNYDVPEIENYEIIKEISNGIFDFAKDYYDAFKKYDYMLNISGLDAYAPFKFLTEDYDLLRNVFGNFSYARGISGDYEQQKVENIKQILEKSRV